MARVLVSGANGFIGTHVVKQLLEAGYKVRGTVRDADKEKYQHLFNLTPNASNNLEIVAGDLLDAACWVPAVKDCTYVCHVASPFPAANPKNEDELIVPAREGTLNVLRAAANEKSVKRVVLTSSLAAICEAGGYPKTLDEKDWCDPAKCADMPYNKSKIVAERAAWDFHEKLPAGKFELCSVNPVIVFGPCLHFAAGTSVTLVKLLMEGTIPMIPPFVFPLVDVRDVAAAQVKCLTNPKVVGHRHLLFGYNVWFKEIAEALYKEFAPQGYNIPNQDMPTDVLIEHSKTNEMLKYLHAANGKPMLLNNHRFTVDPLAIKPIDRIKCIIDTAYSLIEQGIVPKTDKYTGPKK